LVDNTEVISRDKINLILAGSGSIGEFIRYYRKIPSEVPKWYYYKKTGHNQISLLTVVGTQEVTVYTFHDCYLLTRVNKRCIKKKWEKTAQWIVLILIAIIVIIQITRELWF